jgi:hypothetical protein
MGEEAKPEPMLPASGQRDVKSQCMAFSAAQARAPSSGQPLPLPAAAIIAADPELQELAGKIEVLRKRGPAAAWELAWDLENAADRLNGDQVIVPGSGHPQQARQLLMEALALVPNAQKPPNTLGPDQP